MTRKTDDTTLADTPAKDAKESLHERSGRLGEALLDAMGSPDEGDASEAEEEQRRKDETLEEFYRRTGQTPDTTDPDEDFERRMKAWAEPIAERLIASAAGKGLVLHPEWRGEELREGTATLVAAIVGVMIASHITEHLPREMQVAGTGTLRFARDASGELLVTVDGVQMPFERMSATEAYVSEFTTHGFAPPFAAEAAKAAEAAILSGAAYLIGFAYDAEGSTPESAAYVRAPMRGEVEESRERWEAHDEIVAFVRDKHKAHAARIVASLEEAGNPPPSFIKDGLTAEDLALALDILGASLESFVFSEEEPVTAVLSRDGSIRVPEGTSYAHPPFLLERLEGDFATAKPGGLPIDPATLLAWCVDIGRLIPDLFEGLTVSSTDGGLAVAFADDED